MDLTPLEPLRLEVEPERLRQVCGAIISEHQYYATVRPAGASPIDGENRLLIRDDAFGEGIMQTTLGVEVPHQIITGKALRDPVDAILLVEDGFVLFLRAGQMRIEQIPDVGVFHEEKTKYGGVYGMRIIDGYLWVVGRDGIVFKRTEPSNWEMISQAVLPPRGSSRNESYSIGAISGISEQLLIAVGEQNYSAKYIAGGVTRSWGAYSLPRGWLTDVVAQSYDDFWISARMGDVWRGNPSEGFRKVSPNGTTTDFNGIAAYDGRIYLFAPDAELWIFDDGKLTQINPFAGESKLHVSSFEIHSDKLWMQGETGFGVFDGQSWTRIEVPW